MFYLVGATDLSIQVYMTDEVNIGYYRFRSLVSLSDKKALCLNNPVVKSEFTVIVFGMQS